MNAEDRWPEVFIGPNPDLGRQVRAHLPGVRVVDNDRRRGLSDSRNRHLGQVVIRDPAGAVRAAAIGSVLAGTTPGYLVGRVRSRVGARPASVAATPPSE